MSPDFLRDVVSQLRAGPLCPRELAEDRPASLGPDALQQLLPHRSPFLLVDRIEQFDRTRERLRALRHISPDDPIFTGHFPGDPIYPGVLLLECMGQAAVCLIGLMNACNGRPQSVRFTRLHHAQFIRPVRPGAQIEIHVALVEREPLIDRFAGQVWVQGDLCGVSIGDLHVAA